MSLFDFFKRKQAKADKITKVYDKPLPEPTVNPKDNQPSAAGTMKRRAPGHAR